MTSEFSDKSNAGSPSVAGLSVPREGVAPAESEPTRLMISNESNTQDSTEPRAHPDDTGVEILDGDRDQDDVDDQGEIIVAGDEGKILTDGGRDTPLAGQKRCPSGHLCSGSDAYCRQCGADLGGGE